ncbi:MAG: hypothetical protein WBO29_15890 [Albidovulum sp.]
MTALSEYQRLECTGLWRDTPDAQKREVIVSFGDATLVISDARSARALAHWSLPAVLRLNPGIRPALFAPGPDAGEDLEIDDETLIKAIAKVHTIIEARRPHPGRLRTVLLSSALAVVLGLGFFWLPKALIDHTARALPASKRQEIGLAALADLTRLSGAPCLAPEGSIALERLRDRLMRPGDRLYVLPAGVKFSALLPGPIVLLGRDLIENQDTADAAAGHIIAEQLRNDLTDPLLDTLRFAGLRASFELLTTGDLPEAALTGYGEELLARARKPLPDAALLARFAEASVPVQPYAATRDPSEMSKGNPAPANPSQSIAANPVISDSDWVAIQSICSE